MSGKTEIMNYKSRLCYPVDVCFRGDCKWHDKEGKCVSPKKCLRFNMYEKRK